MAKKIVLYNLHISFRKPKFTKKYLRLAGEMETREYLL